MTKSSHDTLCCSYTAPQTSYSAFIAPSDHKVPSLTYTFPLTQDLETEAKYQEAPVYLPELETLSYEDTLYGSEYKVSLLLSIYDALGPE